MSSVRLAALAAVVGCASLAAAAAHAQVYRVVGPDGRVTFTDRPPAEGQAAPAAAVAARAGGDAGSVALPAGLRSVASRYPVTLYTSADCSPCAAARNLLTSRGVPFTEKTISSHDDVQALQRLAGEPRLPFGTIGGQHILGFSDAEWTQYLDAAGYPKVSQLPASYRNPAPTPMVAAQSPVVPTVAQPRQAAQGPATQRTQDAPLPSDPSPQNPLGLRF
jgi:glutaredoxin